jgi:serine/threonine protein kinase
MTDAPASNRFGPYLVQEKLGGGGMAVVYKALNEETGDTVALKVLRASLMEQEGIVERFMQEATIANRLRHPHIVAVNNYGTLKGRFYLELQYLPGGTLAQRFKRPVEMGPQEAVRLLRDVASGLDYAHRKGVVHRDLKLENILLDKRSGALLADFGIARLLGSTHLTATGSVMGTPLYISPEQARGETKLDHRADLYSMAVIAYVLAAGHFPFNASNMLAILNQHVSEPAPPPSSVNPRLPAALDAVLLKGLSKRPEERYPSADTLVEALARAWSYEDQPSKTVIDLWSDHAGRPAIEKPIPGGKTADDWVREAAAASDNQEKIAYLKQALALEPLHSKANRTLFQLEGAKSMRSELPVPVLVNPDDLAPLKKVNRKRKRGVWFYVALLALVLMGLTSTFFILMVIGSPIPDQITSILSGKRPVLDVNGTPVRDIPNIVLTVQPQKTGTLKRNSTVADTLSPGYMHEYTFSVTSGEEIAVGVQFLSPTATRVTQNVAVLKPDGTPAGGQCQQDHILDGDTGIAYDCRIDQSGDWRIRIFGIEGESSGAYAASFQRFN